MKLHVNKLSTWRDWSCPKREWRAAATLCLVIALVFAPVSAHAGVSDLISILTNIYGTLRNGIGTVLNSMQTVNATMRDLQQQSVWPVALVNQARGFVGQMTGQYRNVMWQIHSLPANSATLANPIQLESILRSQRALNVTQLQPVFQRVYQPVPAANDAPSMERNMVDMDDALSQGAMKTAMVSDQSGNQMLSLADALERQAAQAAPGSAPFLTAQAQVANLENQAFLQKILAAELRQEAARLAHENTLRKRSAETARNLRMQVHQVLSRP